MLGNDGASPTEGVAICGGCCGDMGDDAADDAAEENVAGNMAWLDSGKGVVAGVVLVESGPQAVLPGAFLESHQAEPVGAKHCQTNAGLSAPSQTTWLSRGILTDKEATDGKQDRSSTSSEQSPTKNDEPLCAGASDGSTAVASGGHA